MSDNPYAPPQAAPSAPIKPLDRLEGPTGLGGWLILLGISLVLGVLVRCFGLLQNVGVMTGPDWTALTSPGGAAYDPWWGPGIIIEIVMLSGLFALNLYVLFLFFTKRRRFPLFIIIFGLSNILVALIDFVICSLIHNFPEQAKGALTQAIIQSVVYTTVWGLYVTKSLRVRNTFVR